MKRSNQAKRCLDIKHGQLRIKRCGGGRRAGLLRSILNQ